MFKYLNLRKKVESYCELRLLVSKCHWLIDVNISLQFIILGHVLTCWIHHWSNMVKTSWIDLTLTLFEYLNLRKKVESYCELRLLVSKCHWLIDVNISLQFIILGHVLTCWIHHWSNMVKTSWIDLTLTLFEYLNLRKKVWYYELGNSRVTLYLHQSTMIFILGVMESYYLADYAELLYYHGT